MGLHIQPIHVAQRIDYLRRALEPARYNPEETEHIAHPKCGGELWRYLGLGAVGMPELRKLAAGIHPATGESLTARRHDRGGTQVRTAFTSVIFTAPKSVSVLSEVGGDLRLRHCLRESAENMLVRLEEDYAGFRVRKRAAVDRNRPRKTGVAGWITRLENDSRHADPHLHVHTEILNATVDLSDDGAPFKALDVYPLLRDQRILSETFDADLAQRVKSLGYPVAFASGKTFEIEGIDPEILHRFSTGRRRALEQARQATGLPQPPSLAIAVAAEQLRPRKRARTQTELRLHWRYRVSAAELAQLIRLRQRASSIELPMERQPLSFDPERPSPDLVEEMRP
jgi:conjugative relaxase-like TrwC/TraI family protein